VRNSAQRRLPRGYEWLHIGALVIAVPKSAAIAMKVQDEKRVVLPMQQATQADRVKAASSAPMKNPPQGLKFGEECPPTPPGSHRVLIDFQSATSRRVGVSPDDLVKERWRQLRERMLMLGPDRRIVQPKDWVTGLAKLERTMPNFWEPIGALRSALALADAADGVLRLPAMLLLGPPGIGKTRFSQQVAQLLGVPHATVSFDQPSAGTELRGSDKYWANTEAGLLFNLLCLGDVANPVVLLDELDKSCIGSGSRAQDPLAQLHAVLEPQTGRRLKDISTDVEFDASLVTYIATANTIRGIGSALLSRFEVFEIEAPGMDESIEIARRIMRDTLVRLGLQGRMTFEKRCAYVLARLSPRLMQRAVQRAVGEAVQSGAEKVTEDDLMACLLGRQNAARAH